MVVSLVKEDAAETAESRPEEKSLLRAREERMKENALKVKQGVNFLKMESEGKPATNSIFANLKKVTSDDLRGLLRGDRLSDNQINLYFKILEKMNLILHGAKTSQSPNELSSFLSKSHVGRVCLNHTKFSKALKSPGRKNQKNLDQSSFGSTVEETIGQFNSFDTILIPFLPDRPKEQAVLVTLQPKGWMADLYIRESPSDEKDDGEEICK